MYRVTRWDKATALSSFGQAALRRASVEVDGLPDQVPAPFRKVLDHFQQIAECEHREPFHGRRRGTGSQRHATKHLLPAGLDQNKIGVFVLEQTGSLANRPRAHEPDRGLDIQVRVLGSDNLHRHGATLNQVLRGQDRTLVDAGEYLKAGVGIAPGTQR
ncbi:MAG: hypothetical protein H6Q05_5186 [Acidobacteria bacterium]|nr:hypothetical protein [Acidobacteriota bacterium]